MSDLPPPTDAGLAAGTSPQALTPPAIESALADFRAWLRSADAAGRLTDPPSSLAAPGQEPIDLHTLLGQFTALRHEVNLQTRAARAQQEQNAAALQQLNGALETLQQAQDSAAQADEQAQDEALRPVLKTLVDLYDALSLASRELQRVQTAVLPALDRVAASTSPTAPEEDIPPGPERPSFLARWFGRARAANNSAPIAPSPALRSSSSETEQAVERIRRVFDSIVTGYTMSLQRVERALQQHGLEAMDCVGMPFDPEEMEAVEVVLGSGRPASEVIDEVRRGYRWHGRVFRFAQVRVARP